MQDVQFLAENSGADWQPVSEEKAHALWTKLQSAVNPQDIHEQAEGFWVVGNLGNQPIGVVLLKDRYIAPCSFQDDNPVFAKLPRISYSAGPYSLTHFLRNNLMDGNVLRSSVDVQQLTESLQRLFIYHATKPSLQRKPVAFYDCNKPELSFNRAESIAAKAFRNAIKTAKITRPADITEFGDSWASVALAYILGEKVSTTLLTQGGAVQMQILRDSNIHRTKNDLVAQAKAINRRIQHEQEILCRIDGVTCKEEEKPYNDSYRASVAAFQKAIAQARNGIAKNLKPFSQRFVKGLLLANVASARLPIGPLSGAISTTLAEHYGEALAFMQDIEVVAVGRMVPELVSPYSGNPSFGIFVTSDQNKKVLEQPQLILATNVVNIDPRTIYHEFQHARQDTASEEPLWKFQSATYEAHSLEQEAKQAEADFLNKLGILY